MKPDTTPLEPKTTFQETFLSKRELAQALNIPLSSIESALTKGTKKGLLPCKRINKRVIRISLAEARAYFFAA